MITNTKNYPECRQIEDYSFLASYLLGILAAIYIIKRGFWKIKYIEHNKNLVKDEDWKEIHMKVPKRIVIFTIAGQVCYILYQVIHVVEWVMVHCGYLNYFLDDNCEYTQFKYTMGFITHNLWNLNFGLGFLVLML